MKRLLTFGVLVVGGIACGVVIGVNIVMELLDKPSCPPT